MKQFVVFFICLPMATKSSVNTQTPPRIGQPNGVVHLPLTNSDLNSVPTPAMEILLPLLSNSAPPHLLYLIYDDKFKDPDLMLKAYAKTWRATSIIIKFTRDMDPLMEALTDPLTSSSTKRRHILVLCSIQNIQSLFRKVSLQNLENPDTWWIILLESEKDLDLLQGILREGSQVIIMQTKDQRSVKFFSSIVDEFGTIRFHLKGKWRENSLHNGMDLFESLFVDPEEQYSDFKGRQLTLSVNNLIGILTTKKLLNGDLALDSGCEVSLLETLSDALNFTMRITRPPDGKWGGPTSNGSVEGMVGEVFRRNAHFTICSLAIIESRESVIDFTIPYTIRSISLLSRAPKEKSRVLAAFSPFTPEVWISVIIITLLVGLIITMQASISNKYLPEKVEGFSMDNVLFNVTGSLLKQVNFLRAKGFINISLNLWYIFTLILSALYSSMLTATLTKPSFEKPIDSLHDLPEAVANGYTLVTLEGSTLEYMFKFATQGIYAETWKLFNHEDRSKSFVPTQDHRMDEILTEKLTFVRALPEAIFNAAEIGLHLVHIAREDFGLELSGIGCFPGAPFRMSFNKVLQRITEGGLNDKWLNDELQKISSSFTDEENKGHEAFTVSQLQAAFYIMCLGYALAGIVLALELWFKSFS